MSDLPEMPTTVIEVVYPPARGSIGLRGSRAPLSWETTTAPTRIEDDHFIFELPIEDGALVDLKLVRNEEDWAQGRNYTVHAGDHLLLEPYFDRSNCVLAEPFHASLDGWELDAHVLLPPSYEEQERKRYPVLYALDGQSLFKNSTDPFGSWQLEDTLDSLYHLGVMQEVIVVAIDTAHDRLGRLSPVQDAKYGGGAGPEFLRRLIDHLRPEIHARYRCKTDRDNTAILGSSMGGLFAFFAAWSRADVFGKAGCLSSSFWWAERAMIQAVQREERPEPSAVLYLDSGAALSSLEQDANLRDGFHHTRSMFSALVSKGFVPGVDVHRLTFAGLRHDAASWAARVGIPLQLLFPTVVKTPRAAAHLPPLT